MNFFTGLFVYIGFLWMTQKHDIGKDGRQVVAEPLPAVVSHLHYVASCQPRAGTCCCGDCRRSVMGGVFRSSLVNHVRSTTVLPEAKYRTAQMSIT